MQSSLHSKKTDIKFLLKIGMALQTLGMDAYRLESALNTLAEKLNVKADFFSTSTMLMVAINEGENQEHYLKRTNPGDIHLEKLSQINDIGNEVYHGKISTADGLEKIELLEKSKERYSLSLIALCFGLLAPCVSLFMGGNVETAAASFFVGLVVGIITLNKSRLRISQISEAIVAFVAAMMSYTFAYFFPVMSPNIMLLSSVLIVIPGLTLTISVTELAAQNLVAGTSRMMLALMNFFKISFGVAVALKVIGLLGMQIDLHDFQGYDFWVPYLGLILSAFVLTVLFLANPKDLIWITLACFIGFFTADLGTQLLGPHLGMMLGSFSVAVGSNIFTNVANRPILIPQMPGILVLVPGSIGFQSLNYMYEHNLLEGIDAAFQTFSVVVSLVAGIFIGNLIIKTKQNF